MSMISLFKRPVTPAESGDFDPAHQTALINPQPISNTELLSGNVFDRVDRHWVDDTTLIARALLLVAALDEGHRKLFNAIFSDRDRFERFCRMPSSIAGHHAEKNGNLRHTIEVSEEMMRLCRSRSDTCPSLGVLAALLHDAGKADEYIANGYGGWKMSERGKLLGHRVTILEWIVAATAKWNILLPEGHYMGLLHLLAAIPNAPDWMGMRQPVMPESFLLSSADRLSGHDDLMEQTVKPEGGFGRYHKHLKAAPFKVRGV